MSKTGQGQLFYTKMSRAKCCRKARSRSRTVFRQSRAKRRIQNFEGYFRSVSSRWAKSGKHALNHGRRLVVHPPKNTLKIRCSKTHLQGFLANVFLGNVYKTFEFQGDPRHPGTPLDLRLENCQWITLSAVRVSYHSLIGGTGGQIGGTVRQ